MPMTTGQLNKRVIIQTQSNDRDAANAQVDVWNDTATVWANISANYQALTQSPDQLVSDATYRITVRWSRQLSLAVTNRIRWVDPANGTIHNHQIKAIFPLDPANPNTFIVALVHEINGAQ